MQSVKRQQLFVYVSVQAVNFIGGRRIGFKEKFRQPDRSERLRNGVQQLPVLAHNQLTAAAADIDDERSSLGTGPAGLHAEVNQPRLFRPRNNLDVGSEGGADALHELGLVAGIAHRARGDGAGANDTEARVVRRHFRERYGQEIDGFFANAARSEDTLAEPGYLPVLGQNVRL